jgi:pilus assembly protein CpaF
MSFDLILPFFRPIESLLLDDSVSEIMGNPDGSWWYERDGSVYSAGSVKFDARSLKTGLEIIANTLDKHLSEEHPLLNTQLPDGSRLAAILPPVVRPNPAVTIRKFRTQKYTLLDLIQCGSLDLEMAGFLRRQVEDGKTLLISGGTGSGKTTLLNAMADCIPNNDRIVVIEDTAELRITKPNLLAAECQTDTTAKSGISFDLLLRNSLRWRPDRIIVGEIRGEEARTLLDSFNTGHGGSMTTIHANSPDGALHRFAQLAMRSHQQATRDDTAAEIGLAVNFVVQVKRYVAARKIAEIAEVDGYDRSLKTFMTSKIYERTETGAVSLASENL